MQSRSDTLLAGTGPMTLGRTLKGQYRIESELGSGAMGIVFRGAHIALGKAVAIKMLRPDGFNSRDTRERFEREARMASSLNHPGIAQVFDYGIEEGMPYLVMEFIDGKELSDIIRDEGPMAPTQAVQIMRQLAAALSEAHRNGLVHRDIKPQNIKLVRYTKGGQIFIKILDFGIAKQVGGDQGRLTATGAVIGTPVYMAPEQASGGPPGIDGRADLYAAGIVFYELLTGTVPFDAPSLAGVLMGHLTKPPPELPRAVPEPVRRVIARLLKKDPDDRYSDADALDRALALCEDACRGVAPIPAGSVESTRADSHPGALWTWRSALIIGLGSMAVAGVVMVLVLLYGPFGRSATQTGIPGPGPRVPPTQVTQAVPDLHQKTVPETPRTPGTEKHRPNREARDAPKPQDSDPPPEAPASHVSEHKEVREILDRAKHSLDAGELDETIRLARQSLGSQQTPRAHKLIALAFCKKGDLGNARASLFSVAAGHKREVIEACLRNNIQF